MVKKNYNIKLTDNGKAVAQRMKEERAENIERNDGEYIPDPWYKRFLSPVELGHTKS